MAAATMEAVIKKMPMKWGQVIVSDQFKRRIGDDEQMSSLFKSVAENKDVLKQLFKAIAEKGKKTSEEKKNEEKEERVLCQGNLWGTAAYLPGDWSLRTGHGDPQLVHPRPL